MGMRMGVRGVILPCGTRDIVGVAVIIGPGGVVTIVASAYVVMRTTITMVMTWIASDNVIGRIRRDRCHALRTRHCA